MGMFDRIKIAGNILPMEGRELTPNPNELIYQTKDINPDVRGKLEMYTLVKIAHMGEFCLLGPNGAVANHINCKHFRFYNEDSEANYEFVGEIKDGIFKCLHFCENDWEEAFKREPFIKDPDSIPVTIGCKEYNYLDDESLAAWNATLNDVLRPHKEILIKPYKDKLDRIREVFNKIGDKYRIITELKYIKTILDEGEK